MYYVYVLQSLKNKTFYKGLSENLDERIEEHKKGKSEWAKTNNLFRLIHVEICSNRMSARKMEKYLKSGFGREIIKEILESFN